MDLNEEEKANLIEILLFVKHKCKNKFDWFDKLISNKAERDYETQLYNFSDEMLIKMGCR